MTIDRAVGVQVCSSKSRGIVSAICQAKLWLLELNPFPVMPLGKLPTLRAQKPCVPPAHCDNVGGDATNRFRVAASGAIFYTGTNIRSADEGQTLPGPERYDYSVLYRSDNMGQTFQPVSVIGQSIAEVDVLPLLSLPPQRAGAPQTLLASLRYQQSYVSQDDNASQFFSPFYKQTAISRSTDSGKT